MPTQTKRRQTGETGSYRVISSSRSQTGQMRTGSRSRLFCCSFRAILATWTQQTKTPSSNRNGASGVFRLPSLEIACLSARFACLSCRWESHNGKYSGKWQPWCDDAGVQYEGDSEDEETCIERGAIALTGVKFTQAQPHPTGGDEFRPASPDAPERGLTHVTAARAGYDAR